MLLEINMMNVFCVFVVSLTPVDVILYKQNCSMVWWSKSIVEQLEKLSWTVLSSCKLEGLTSRIVLFPTRLFPKRTADLPSMSIILTSSRVVSVVGTNELSVSASVWGLSFYCLSIESQSSASGKSVWHKSDPSGADTGLQGVQSVSASVQAGTVKQMARKSRKELVWEEMSPVHSSGHR